MLVSSDWNWMDSDPNQTMPPPPHAVRVSTDARAVAAQLVGSICALLLFAMPALAQSAAQPIPVNASAKSYGDGWDCDIGYRLNGDTCDAVFAPQNAYETNRPYGLGWECIHGFRRVDGVACVAVAVPEGGYLGPSGERWHCSRGFLKVDDSCVEIILPTNAYLTESAYGSAWECDRGFESTGDLCAAIAVPTNAYLNTSSYGQPWTCERGYYEQDGLCEAVIVPSNAYFDDAAYGNGWKCDRGYAPSGQICEAIVVPVNAHLDRSGNRWDCNKNFRKSDGRCVLGD